MINPVAVVVIVMAVLTFYVGVHHLVIYWRGLREKVNLYFALACFSLAFYDIFCALLYNSSNIQDGSLWMHGQFAMICTAEMFVILFLFYHIGKKPNRIFANLFMSYYTLQILLILFLPDRFVLDQSRPEIKVVPLGLLGQITYYEVRQGIVLFIQTVVGLSLLIYAFGVLIHHYWKTRQHKLIPLIVAFSLFFLGAVNDTLVASGFYLSIYLIEYSFMAIVLVMTFSLTDKVVEYVRTRKMLEETEAGFRNVAALSPGAMMIVTRDTCEFINPRFEEMFGYSLSEIGSRWRWLELAYPDSAYRKQMEKRWDEEVREENALRRDSFVSMVRCKRKVLKYVNLRFFPIGGGRYILLAEDITELKNEEHVLKRSEERLSKIIDIIPHMIYVKDADDKFLLLNRKTAETYGLPPSELVGKRHQDVHPDREEMRRYLIADGDVLLKNESRVDLEELFHDVNGQVHVLQTTRTPMGYNSVVEDAVLTVSVDISELKQAEKEIRKREEDLRVTLNSIGDAVIVTDTDARISILNPIAEKMTGWRQDEGRGMKVGDLLQLRDPETEARVEDPVNKVLAQGTHFALNRNLQLVSRSGTVRDVHESSAPIMDQDGKVIGVILVFRDMTQEIKIQEQLLQSEKMQTVGQLAGGVAHDFNNMLAGIMGYAELSLQNVKDSASCEPYIGNIIKIAERAADLTSKLLSFSRRGKIQSVTVDVHSLIRIVTDILSHTIDRRIEIQKELLSTFPDVMGDPAQLQNMILNIALNARDAMPDGGILLFRTQDIKLRNEYFSGKVETPAPGDYIKIEVTDTGIGMDKETLSNIFEPFFTTKMIGKGTGLGLSAVYGSIKEHKGFIDVESEPGKGSRFQIYLPIASGGIRPGAFVSSDKLMRGVGTVLVVDDEETVRQISCEMLRNLGYTVLMAGDGLEAVRIFEKEHAGIDLVLLDMVMPGMNGRDAFFELQKIDPDVKVIISTGFNMGMELQNLFDKGLRGLLQKPFIMTHLSSLVHDILMKPAPK